MKTEVRTITPLVAKEMLKKNLNNRKLNEKHVSFLSNQMKSEKWLFDGQPIRFDVNNVLLDGQHRLNSIIESKTTQNFLIITGLPSEAFKVMDTGKNRSASDCLFVDGQSYSHEIAACAKFVMRFESGLRSHSAKVTNTDVLDWYDNNKIIVDYIRQSDKLQKQFSRVLPKSYIASLMYIMAKKNTTDSEFFMNKLCNGLDLTVKDPIFLLRKKLIEDKMSKSSLAAKEKLALIIKAWNLFRLKKETHFLRWNKESEKFPTMI